MQPPVQLRDVWVLRLSHRAQRDARVTTHVALVARAFGARGMYYSGDRDPGLEESVEKVCRTWGGDFKVTYVENPVRFVREWRRKGPVVHLTMYGIGIDEKAEELRSLEGPMLVVVGSEKVPRVYYDLATYNIAIGHQPHSEVAAIAIFLDRLYMGRELSLKFPDAALEIVPCERGKMVRRRRE